MNFLAIKDSIILCYRVRYFSEATKNGYGVKSLDILQKKSLNQSLKHIIRKICMFYLLISLRQKEIKMSSTVEVCSTTRRTTVTRERVTKCCECS